MTRGGWGPVDIQGTAGVSLPTSVTFTLGRTFIANDTVQMHGSRILWAEVEMNAIRFINGPHAGRTEVFVTPALLVGRFHVTRRDYFPSRRLAWVRASGQ